VLECETLVIASHFVLGAALEPQTKLILEGFLKLPDDSETKIFALVDTGAEISLVRKGLLGAKYFQRSKRPKRFLTANEGVLDGGLQEVPCDLILWGICLRTEQPTGLVCPCSLYDANINVDVILSYEWLGRMKMDVCCHQHGLLVGRDLSPVWVGGLNFPKRTNRYWRASMPFWRKALCPRERSIWRPLVSWVIIPSGGR
jgi:hypothetical protein